MRIQTITSVFLYNQQRDCDGVVGNLKQNFKGKPQKMPYVFWKNWVF